MDVDGMKMDSPFRNILFFGKISSSNSLNCHFFRCWMALYDYYNSFFCYGFYCVYLKMYAMANSRNTQCVHIWIWIWVCDNVCGSMIFPPSTLFPQPHTTLHMHAYSTYNLCTAHIQLFILLVSFHWWLSSMCALVFGSLNDVISTYIYIYIHIHILYSNRKIVI